MATASTSTIPSCSICRESFTTPKSLPCGHTFCLTCIEQCIAERRGAFRCPLCKQDVNIPKGGANSFPTNFTVQEIMVFLNNQGKKSSLSFQPNQDGDQPNSKCPKHIEHEVNDYCNDCNVGLCSNCQFIGNHKHHDTLDLGSDVTRIKAIEELQSSKKIIQNRIKNLVSTRSTLQKSLKQLEVLCEESCTKVTEIKAQIVSDVDTIIKNIRDNLEENRGKVKDREKEITSDIKELESGMESNIPPSTKTTLGVLQTLHNLKEIEKQGENRKDYNLRVQYLQWKGKDFSLNIDQLGSLISQESFNFPGSYQFLFDVNDIGNNRLTFSRTNKFRNNKLVFRSNVARNGGDLYTGIVLLPEDIPRLHYCIIDCRISLLNFDDDKKTRTKILSAYTFDKGDSLVWNFITLSKLLDKNNGYLNSRGKFVIQYDITKIREISWE